MRHCEYIRTVQGSRKAVLMIHGIAGTPNHFMPLIPAIPKDWSVYSLLLDGHGGTVQDFSRTSMKKWKAQVDSKVRELMQRYDVLLIVGHSMGTLFAIHASLLYPKDVSGLFLIASPLKVCIRPAAIRNSIRTVFDRIDPRDPVSSATRAACGIKLNRRVWLYLGWIPRFLELLREIRRTRRLTDGISVPCLVFQSRNDELVARAAAEYFPKTATVTFLEQSGHYYYDAGDMERMRAALRGLCSKLSSQTLIRNAKQHETEGF